jgi:CSLREA domain-containing protein
MLIYLGRVNSRAIATPSHLEGSILVTTLDDELNSDGDCSLREAIEAANTNTSVDACGSGGVLTDTITFDVAGIITVTSQLEVTAGGPLVIDGSENISTTSGAVTAVWWGDWESEFTLQNFSVINGHHGGLENYGNLTINNCIFKGNSGYAAGAIFNGGAMIIKNSIISDNIADANAGGIMNNGNLAIYNSSIYGNTSSGDGGGILNDLGILVINNSNLYDNFAHFGGGIANIESGIIINNSTISNNSASSQGGGVYNWWGTVTITNTTLSGDNAQYGGGVYNIEGNININNSTLSSNVADSLGGGLFSEYGSIMFSNTIIANSLSGGNCTAGSGIITDAGHNIDTDDTCNLNPANGSLPNTNPLLGPLQDNGGPTWTHALSWYSPAIDAGDAAQCPATDQRGISRPRDGDGDGLAVCDIGSYEVEGPPVSPLLVNISGLTTGLVGQIKHFTAVVEPFSTTIPLTYTWQATGQLPITQTAGLSDTVDFQWEITGTQLITVTARNMVGSVSDTHAIILTLPEHELYLPLVIKSNPSPQAPNSSVLHGGIFTGLVSFGIVGRLKKRLQT